MTYNVQPETKGLIFDLDGTLADTMPFHFKAWQAASAKYGANIDSDFLRKRMGGAGWIIAGEIIDMYKLDGDLTPEKLIKEKQSEFTKFQHLLKPIEPVTDIVRRYHGILPMAVGTGGNREAVQKTLEATGLLKYFDIIVTANDVESHKPHPETFLKCAAMMKVDPADIEVFEDSELGIQAGINAGMKVVDVSSWYDSSW